MSTHRLFLYGTLMRGEGAHHLLRNAAFVGDARTEPVYELADLGPFPGLVEGGATAVAGELYDVDEDLLALLDDYEGVPEPYERRLLALAGGARAEGYVLRPRHAEGHRRIPSGDWRQR